MARHGTGRGGANERRHFFFFPARHGTGRGEWKEIHVFFFFPARHGAGRGEWKSSYDHIIIKSYHRIIILSYYHNIIWSSNHNTKWLKSFSVPSQVFRHILSHLPLLQGSLPKNKGSSGNNFLRLTCHWRSEIHSSSKTPVSWKQKSTSKFFWTFFCPKKISASKNEKLQIVWNAFCQSFTPIGAMFGG